MRCDRRHRSGVLTKVDLAIISKPQRRITVAGIYVSKRDGEVNKVEIEVVKTPVLKLFLRQCLDLHLRTASSWCNLGSREKEDSHDHGHGRCSKARD